MADHRLLGRGLPGRRRRERSLSAYSEAQTIEKHALEASGGQTYAELPREDERRQTVMTASFLRAG